MPDDGGRTMTSPGARARATPTRWVEISSPGNPPVLRLREGIARIGRDDSNDVVIVDPYISRCHVEVRAFPHGFELVDMDTKNGTHYQGARIRELALRGEVSLVLGRRVTVTIRVGDDNDVRTPREAPGALVGVSLGMARMRAAIEKLAPSQLTVLIEGETGTGKEVVARMIHAMSHRAAKPFVVFDCASVSPALIASELFGHVRGAYTGAVGAAEGAFRHAHGGTLLLDEIGELPLELQPALLRALEARQVKPVGGDGYIPVDVRVLAATNRSLEDEVDAGRFRRDLLFRVAIGRLRVPALRERGEDVAALAVHFAESYGATLTDEALAGLDGHAWPGNVRELRNLVERAVMLSGGTGAVVTRLDTDDPLGPDAGTTVSTLSPETPLEGQGLPFQDAKQAAVDRFERDYLVKLFDAAGCNLSEAARRSGVHRRYLRELFKKHGLDPADLRARTKGVG